MPWLTPETLGGGAVVCRPLFIPNDIRLIAAVSGALLDLTKTYNWEAFGAVSPDEVSAAMLDMLESYFTEACENTMPLGVIFPYATASPPSGAVPCDGTVYADTDYPAFWAVIDPAWKTDATHWAAPDLDGRFIVGSGISSYSPGDVGGQNAHALTVAEMPAHAGHADYNVGNATPGTSALYPSRVAGGNTTGGGTAHENRPPYTALPYALQVE